MVFDLKRHQLVVDIRNKGILEKELACRYLVEDTHLPPLLVAFWRVEEDKHTLLVVGKDRLRYKVVYSLHNRLPVLPEITKFEK